MLPYRGRPATTTIDFRRDRQAACMDVTAIIVNYKTAALVGRAIAALDAGASGLTLQVIVVDNRSNDGSVERIRRENPNCDLIANDENVGFGRANVQALSLARGRYVLLLNSDAFMSPAALEASVSFMDEHPDCGVLGAKLVGEDGQLQPSCRYFPTPWNVFLARSGLSRFFPRSKLVDDMQWDHATVRDCDWVPGCFYLVRREVITAVGLFDPRYFLYYEEVDHCRAVKAAGWRVVFYPHASAIHLGGESAKASGPLTSAGKQLEALQIESETLYFRKHHGRSGLWLALMLSLTADAILVAKAIARPASPATVRDAARHAYLTLVTCVRTRLATRPTR